MTNHENGRSMVEMLGVLAIMGIITVGGLTGFKTAMQKLRANAITELMVEMSVVAQTRNRCIKFDDLEDADEYELPNCVDNIQSDPNGIVKITFSNDSECNAIKQIIGTSFGKCKLDIKEGVAYYIPTRSEEDNMCEPNTYTFRCA